MVWGGLILMTNIGDVYNNFDTSKLNQPIMADSSYNLRMKEEQQKKQIEEKVKAINAIRDDYKYNRDKYDNYIGLMNFVEKLLHACGGEAKANFVEVARDFMKLATRVPMKANLHQFLPEDDKNNPRFHKIVTQILLEIPSIEGIRWVPTPEGTFLILSISRDMP
jgi:hypothetical protein